VNTRTRKHRARIGAAVIAAASTIVALALTLAFAFAFAPAARGEGVASQKIELPPFRGTLRDDYYPADARLHLRQGRALVEFSVDARGMPTDVVLLNAEPSREFDEAARLLARNLRYQVPPGWEQGAAARRFRLGVRFQVLECINFSRCDPNAHNPPADYEAADRTYVVSAQKRVVVLLSQPPAAPPPAPAPTMAPAPRATPPAAPPSEPSEEPVYPPG
jgi:TonB family protein